MAERDTRGRCRSRSASGLRDDVYGSDYKRRKSSPACSSRSCVSGSSTASSGKSQTESVSYWTRQRAEQMGIFYAREAADIKDFYKISEKSDVEESFIYPLTGKNKQILDSLVKFIKEKLKRTTEFKDNPVTEGRRSSVRAIRNMKLCEEMKVNIDESEIEEQDEDLKCNFPKKRVMKINDVPTASVPDLRIRSNREGMTVGVVEVKGTRLRKGASHEKFKVQGVLNDRVLGQHAGELLVHNIESLFGEEAVLGILCMQTTIIFTFLEISKDHIRKIEEDGNVLKRTPVGMLDEKDSGTILYTKPYDYLNEEDREEVIEFLVWLGLQIDSGKYRLQKE